MEICCRWCSGAAPKGQPRPQCFPSVHHGWLRGRYHAGGRSGQL